MTSAAGAWPLGFSLPLTEQPRLPVQPARPRAAPWRAWVRGNGRLDGRPTWRPAPQREAHHPGAAPGGAELPETEGRKLGFALASLGFVKDERDHRAPQQAVRRSRRSTCRQFEIDPAVIKLIPAETAQKYQIVPLAAIRRHADDRDDRPDQRVRHGRHQVHDGLQRRAGRGLGDGGRPTRMHALLRRAPRAAAAAADDEAAKPVRSALRTGQRSDAREHVRRSTIAGRRRGARRARGDRALEALAEAGRARRRSSGS